MVHEGEGIRSSTERRAGLNGGLEGKMMSKMKKKKKKKLSLISVLTGGSTIA